MVHPGDREKLKEETRHLSRGEIKTLPPYRLMREKGDYLYVIEQARMTDFYGAPCWQCVALDVTGVMRVRNQMKLLSRFVNDSILFLHSRGEQKIFEVVVHGLAHYMGLSHRDFEKALNSGEFCRWVEGNVDLPPEEFCALFLAAIQERQREFVVHVPGKGALPLLARADRVNDGTDLAYIVVMSVTPGDISLGEDREDRAGK